MLIGGKCRFEAVLGIRGHCLQLAANEDVENALPSFQVDVSGVVDLSSTTGGVGGRGKRDAVDSVNRVILAYQCDHVRPVHLGHGVDEFVAAVLQKHIKLGANLDVVTAIVAARRLDGILDIWIPCVQILVPIGNAARGSRGNEVEKKNRLVHRQTVSQWRLWAKEALQNALVKRLFGCGVCGTEFKLDEWHVCFQ